MQIPDMEKLKVFYEVAKNKNFTKAAEKLYRTQPAISQSVKYLEDELNEKLFIRKGKTTILTQAGEMLMEHVEKAFKILETGRMRIEALKELNIGKLTISASDTISCYILPPVLKAFHTKYPAVEIRILNSPSPEAARQVAEHESDLGIVTMPLNHPKLIMEPVITREDVVIFNPEHPLSKLDDIVFEDVLNYQLLLLDKMSNTRRFFDYKISRLKREPEIIMELGNIEVIKKLVQMGFGISIVPYISVMEEIKQGKLMIKKIFPKEECRVLGFAYPAGEYMPPAVRIFMNMCKKHLAGAWYH